VELVDLDALALEDAAQALPEQLATAVSSDATAVPVSSVQVSTIQGSQVHVSPV
jgi:hypothetical protein